MSLQTNVTKKANIAVMVSGGGTNLQALIDACAQGIITHGNISLVISDKKDAYALTRAQNALIPSYYIKKTTDKHIFEEQVQDLIAQYQIDLIVLAGFTYIFTAEFTKAHQNRIINVHPSLIPQFCGKGFYGMRVHEAVIKSGVAVTGATVHYVNEIPDGGQIIVQKRVCVYAGDTPETLQRRVMEQAEWDILPRATEQLCKIITEEQK